MPSAERRRPPPRLPLIDPARCTGCGRCVAACGPRVLSLETVRWRKTATLHDAAGCTGCSLCERRCPFGAIAMGAAP
ncbi:MAG TPA: 4Fe-4S binding protein [Burkholderiaceae bacterium]